MSIFKGTIEKRIMSHVKNIIAAADRDLKEHRKLVEDNFIGDLKALELKREDDIKKKEDQLVEKLFAMLG